MIDKVFVLFVDKMDVIESIDEIGGVILCLEFFGLVLVMNIIRGVLVVGVDLVVE